MSDAPATRRNPTPDRDHARDPDRVRDVVVVGGGPAGLAAALRLRDLDLMLLEREPRLGGRLRSERRDPYWLNLGGHLFQGIDSRSLELVEELGLEAVPIPGSKTALFHGGRLYTISRAELYPLLLRLSGRDRVALAATGLRLMRHVRRWYRAVQCRPDETDAQHRGRVSRFETDRTFADLLGRMPEQVTRIFRAAARRAAGELDEQSAGVGLSIFGSLWMGDSSRGVRNILGGSGRVGAAARTRLGRAVVLGAEVTTVREVHDGAEVGYRTADGEHTVRARQVVLAIPAPLARTVLTGLPAEVDRALGTVTYGPFVCMGVITSEDGPTPWDDVYAITTPGLAFDMLFNHANPVRAPGRRAPGGSLMCYAGGAHASALLDLDDNVIRDRFLADVLTILPQVRGRVLEAVVQKWPQGNVYRTPHTDFDEVLNWNDRQGAAVRLAGDYFAELGGTIEAATRSGLAAAVAVRAALRHPAGEHPRNPRSTAPDYADRAGGPR